MVKGRILAQGRYAVVYEWDEGTVLKLFREDLPSHLAKGEFLATRLVHELGVSVPRPHEMVTVKGRPGLVLELVEGPSMQDRLEARGYPRMDVVTENAQRLATYHAQIHELSEPRLPPRRDRLAEGIARTTALDEGTRSRLFDIVSDLPDRETVCHDDLHPRNVIMSPEGPVILDWMTASRGDPAADVARSLLVMEAGQEWDSTRVRELRRHFRSVYLHSWCFRTGVSPEEVAMWRVPVAALRLGEAFPGEERWLLHIIREALR